MLVEGTDGEITTATARDYLSARLTAAALPGTELVVETYKFMYGNLRNSDDEIA